jgi:hypothetical protein
MKILDLPLLFEINHNFTWLSPQNKAHRHIFSDLCLMINGIIHNSFFEYSGGLGLGRDLFRNPFFPT